jgi:galactokinase
MWEFEQAPPAGLPDLDRCLAVLNAHHGFFAPDRPLYLARAPGRLDLMGGIADYSGALVLQLPLVLATRVAAQLTGEPVLEICNPARGAAGDPGITLPLAELTPAAEPLSYPAAHQLLTADPARSWLAYVAGVLVVLHRALGLRLLGGLRLLIDSDVPIGKGVSSSAALEVATMQAVCTAAGWTLDGRELALLCQRVENLIVGAPCGVMDQMAAACGEQDRLLALLCQPAELQPSVALPRDVEVWGIDSGIHHAVTGADYGSVRVGAFMGYRIIAALAGLPATPREPGRVAVDDAQWRGYLANIAPSVWESTYRAQVPEMMDGATFLTRYGGSTDTVTRVDPARIYPVRAATEHPIWEHHRVRLFRALLRKRRLAEEDRILLGELMYQSHAGYSACGLGADGTDRLVALVREAGPAAGLYGAKITGGGSGGTVAVLARRGQGAAVEALAARYTQETGRPATVLGGSSPGAVQFGFTRLRATTG